MKLQALTIPTTVRYQLIDERDEMTDVYITAHTPDSKEWRQAQAKYAGAAKTRTMRMGKDGGEMDIPVDREAHEKRCKLLASVVTGIEGIEDWTYSPANVEALFLNDGCAWMVDRLDRYLGERSNFLGESETTATSGSIVSSGSTPATPAIDIG